MDTGVLASSSAAESEEVSEGSLEVEDSSSAESGPAHSGPAKGGTGGRSGTAAGTKRKPEVGPTLPRSKTKNLRARLESTLVYQLERFSLNVLILYLESQWCPRFCILYFSTLCLFCHNGGTPVVVGHQAGTCWVIFPAGNGTDWATFPADSVYQPRDS